MIKTPKNRRAYIAVLVFLYLIQAVGEFLHNAAVYWSIPAPPNFHAPPYIGSPFFVAEIEAQAIILVFLAALSAFPILRYSGNVSLFAWQRSRPFWSLVWSVVLTAGAVFLVYEAIRIYVYSRPYIYSGLLIGDLIGSTALAAILLCVRA